ncbi:MAG: metallophosphoesterase, partial [Planctomycetota bacterium]
MRVIQLSDPHLGPTTHPDGTSAGNHQRAWQNAERVAEQLRGRPDADELIVVITGDLTDEGHVNPAEYPPAVAWLKSLPGTVLAVPGNHDVGNFVSARATPTVSETYLARWREHVGDDRFAFAADGTRLLGLNSMLYGSGLPQETDQRDWLEQQLHTAETNHENLWVFQHAPLFLREPDETREPREHYWCPAADARDEILQRLQSHEGFIGLAYGHVHRRFKQHLPETDQFFVACPALSGTHTDADY